ncbi:MAG: CoA transferase, partial [Kangiellaceae bacterium]
TPMYDPLIGTLYSFQTNLGKKSALIDITTPAGREVFERLVKTVDIVVINASERQLKPLGLDHDSLKLIKSDILFCRLDCFGGPKRGPKSDYIGYDDIIQANSGIMSRFGGEQTPEEHAHIGTLDVNCGFAAGLSMALALYHKQQTGHTSLSRTSLSAVTHLAQIKFAFDYQGYVPFNEPSGRKVLGYNALSHFYKTQDGYIFIDSNESELSKLADIPGLSGILEAENLSEFLAQILAKENSEHWVNALQSSNIAAAQSIGIGKLRAQYSRSADGSVGIDRGSYAFSIYEDHPSGHKVTIIDQYAIRPEEAEIVAIHPTERLGYSTIKILAELGYKDDDISAMINSKIAGTGWGKEYLPS